MMTGGEEEGEEEAAFLAERARLEALLSAAAASASSKGQQQDGFGEEEEPEGEGEGEGEGDAGGVRYVRIKPCADPSEEAAVSFGVGKD
jgi:hypothetical protein